MVEQLTTAAKTLARWCYCCGVDERILRCGAQLREAAVDQALGRSAPAHLETALWRQTAALLATAARLGPRPPGESPAGRGVHPLRRGGRPLPQPRPPALSRVRWPAAPHRRRGRLRHSSLLRSPWRTGLPRFPRAHGPTSRLHLAGPVGVAATGEPAPFFPTNCAADDRPRPWPALRRPEDRRNRCRSNGNQRVHNE